MRGPGTRTDRPFAWAVLAAGALVLGQQGDLLTATRGELEALLNGSANRLNR